MNKRIIFSMGGKGGVGKTTAMVALAEYFEYHGVPTRLLDCDTENKHKGSLSSFFPAATKINIRKTDGMDVFIDSVESDNNPIVLADLGAGSGMDVLKWFSEMYASIAEEGISFLAAGSVCANPGSLETLFSWGGFLQKQVEYLVVKNQFQGPIDLWEKGEMAAKFKEQFAPGEIELSERIPEWQTSLENYGLTLTAALKDPKYAKISAQIRLKSWRKQAFDQFDSVRELLVNSKR